MGRTKGSKNKDEGKRPPTCELTTEQRLQLVANLIIDRITYDEQHDQELLKKLERIRACVTV